MSTPPEHDARVVALTFASVYPHHVNKVEKKGRTKEELNQIIKWLTGFDKGALQALIEEKVTFRTLEHFFKKLKYILTHT